MSFARRYAENQSETASPERLMVLLFERALGHMQRAAVALEAGDPAAAREPLEKATRIVAELSRTLDASRLPDLGHRLLGIYRFVGQRLLEASLGRDPGAVRDALRALSPVADAFAGAVRSTGGRP